MSISYCDKVLLESLYKLNRPIVTIFTLHKILNDNGHSVLTKSLFYFYYRIFKDKDMFERINSLHDEDCLPWLLSSEKELWGNPFKKNREGIEEEAIVKDEEIWRAYLTKWHKLFFKNSIFYPKWSEEDGYGLYCRQEIIDIRVVLQDPIILYGTFLESITEVDKEVLEAFGFCSFFEYKTADESKISPYSVLCGLLMLANSSQQVIPDCPISFEHVYQFDDDNEVDCNIGDPYRTIETGENEFNTSIQFGAVNSVDLENTMIDGDIDYIRRKRIFKGELDEECIGTSEQLRQVFYAVRAVYWNPSDNDEEPANIRYEKDQQFYINYKL